MLSCPCQHLPLYQQHRHRNRHGNFTAAVHQHQNSENPLTTTSAGDHDSVLRTHNSISTSLLQQHLKLPNQLQNNTLPHLEAIPAEEKVKFLEMSLITKKRLPRFPGAVSLQFTTENDIASPLKTLFRDENDSQKVDDLDEEMVMRALKIRRKVTAEIFKQAMAKGKFGITYSTNLTDRLGEFIDYVMIEAAALKKIPEFEVSSFNVRARTVIDDLKVVPLIRWLKHNHLSYNKIAKLICMSRGNLGSIRRVAEWLKSIHVKGDFVGAVLVKAGENILERSQEELEAIVEYLESNGVRRDWMGYVMSRCPQLLSCTMKEVKIRVAFFLDMGLNEKDFGTMIFEYPRVLGYFTLEEMNQKVNYLKEFGLSDEEVGRLLAFKPQLMSCSIEERWKPLIQYFYYLGISRDGIRRMLFIKPMVFCVDLEKTIVPKVRFFQDIGIHDGAIGNMLAKFPPLLTYSLYKKIRPVVIFLMTKAGVAEKDIGKVIALAPELLGCSIVHKLEVNVKYFLSLGIRLQQLGQMIADFPMLLRYNTELLRPKYLYLRRNMIRPLQDLIDFPRYLSYSLEERIIPRHKVLVENQVNLKLRYMLACTDEEFGQKVESAVERRQRYKATLVRGAPISSPLADDFEQDNTSFSLLATNTDPSDALGSEDFESL
ncbi:hypothetical protein K2173_002364 [Erythroxylum novogranatense]|uniref:Embryo defective 2219 n=1 Tax=Erythroxylum novogranatense TaxID=1862640 RepID=A0AAV8T9H7_9ROSI|nr:hypothetical protein K2173_002364 [Erythroxylum novogranatense]